MKKLIGVIIFSILMFSCAYAADYGVIGEVLSTDIIAFIDEQPIVSYNIGGYTYVVCEDLSGYGFKTVWDGEKRELLIFREREAERIFPGIDFINVKKTDIKTGEHVCNVYNTDIITYLNGKKIPACNVNGKTLINTQLLAECGIVSYNNDLRTIKIDLLSFDLNEYLKKPETIIPSEKIEGKIKYNGDIKDNAYDGYGVVTEEYEYTYGLQSTEKYFISGLFSKGEENGYICRSGYKIPHNGSDRRKRDYFSLAKYENGEVLGYSLSITYADGILDVRNEQKGNYKRICIPDASYKYGYKIEKEGYTNSWGEIISYEKIPAPEIKSVEAGSVNVVYDYDGNIYAFGKNIFKAEPYSSDAPVLTDENSIKTNNYFALEENKLYRNFSNGKRELISDDVTAFSANSLYLMFMKKDASVYTVRLNFEEGSGSSWFDGFDMSSPVKVFENAKAISNKGRYLVIDENNTLWSWSSPYYKTKYENDDIKDNPYTVDEPVKIAEDVVKAECASKFIAYIKNDGALYINKEVEEGENVFGITEETKITDNVKDFSVSQNMILIVKNDGALYTMGKTVDYTLGIPFVKEALTPTQITIFGKYQNITSQKAERN